MSENYFDNKIDSDPLSKDDAFDVTLDSFEGPLSLLLLLAQKHKIDITLVSLKPLVDQYIDFVEKHPNIEACADYLRMASYLIWLKSRRLLPSLSKEPTDELAEEKELIQRLQHLQAIRKAGNELQSLPQLGRDYWQVQTSLSSPFQNEEQPEKTVPIPDMTTLLTAYGAVLSRQVTMPLQLLKAQLFDMETVLSSITEKLSKIGKKKWIDILSLLPNVENSSPQLVLRSSVSATFLTILFLCHQGKIGIRQSTSFAPIYVVVKNKK